MAPPEGFIVSAVVAPLVANNPQELVPLLLEDSAQGQAFGERHFGGILGGAGPVEDGS